jgi:outer membrane protein OmpA-like peptidoglycan-associated protein
MRTSFIVGIFGLAVAVAATTEWASRRAVAGQTENKPAVAGSNLTGPDTSGTDTSPPSLDVAENVSETGTYVLDGFRVNAVSVPEVLIDKIDVLFAGPDAADLLCGTFVIEGHTDNLGSKDVNHQIGLARALAVRQYLGEQYEIMADAMRVVSYGADRPVGDNNTEEGRSRNRRVVIRVIPDTH